MRINRTLSLAPSLFTVVLHHSFSETIMEKSPLQRAANQIAAGGIAGFAEICMMHPLDIAKTRLQMQSSVGPMPKTHYNGVFDCFAKMYRQEGLRSYWKGILPPILVETPKTAVRFFTFEQSKKFFLFEEDRPTPLVRKIFYRRNF